MRSRPEEFCLTPDPEFSTVCGSLRERRSGRLLLMAAARLLIVEDDLKTAAALASGLERGGFSTATAHTGEEGFFLLNAETFDLVVLDWMLPGRSGIEILNEGQGINLIHTVRGVGFVLREEANA